MCKAGPDKGTYNLDFGRWTNVQYACKQKCLKVDEDRKCERLDQIHGHGLDVCIHALDQLHFIYMSYILRKPLRTSSRASLRTSLRTPLRRSL